MKDKFSLNEYKAFYEIVKEWSVKSHRNQKITSEVIINMLLSPFIGELVSFALKRKTKVKLLAKEFPIEVFLKNSDYLQYASADYLLYDKNMLYLTELKTTTSVDGKQILNMLYNCKEGANDFWQPLKQIIINRIEKKNTELPTQKYLYTLSLIAKNLNLKDTNIAELSIYNKKNNRGSVAKDIIEKTLQKLNTKDIKIIYVSLYNMAYDEITAAAKSSLKTLSAKNKKDASLLKEYKNNLDDLLQKYLLKPIVIEDTLSIADLKLSAKKQGAWSLVKNIFDELLENPNNWLTDFK